MDSSFLNFVVVVMLVAFSLPVPSSSIHSSLSAGSSLDVQNKDDVLMSSNEVFSAGFHSVGVNAYCFAIWFTDQSLSDQNHVVVWMANRDYLVNKKGSKLSLLKNGNLVLIDAGQWHPPVWETVTNSNTSVVTLSLEDNGNLVLYTSEGERVWQSFDSPTDTLLPHQPLTRGMMLISTRSSTNYSSGFYKFRFDEYNILRLSLSNLEVSSVYWPSAWKHPAEANRTMYNSSKIAVLDGYGYFSSTDNFKFTTSDFGSRIWRRLVLEPDGNIRVYSLDEKTKVWEVTWQAISRPCHVHGICGLNSLCTYSQNSGRKCKCLPGHTMKVQTDWSYGCEPDFKPLDDDGRTYGFLPFSQSDFYGYDSGFFINFTFDRCKDECLSNQDCKGFLFRANGSAGQNLCYTKSRLLNGQQKFGVHSYTYVKLPTNIIEIYEKMINPLEGNSGLNCSGQDIMQLGRDYKKNSQNDSVKYMLWFVCALGGFEVILVAYFFSVNMGTYEKNQVYHQVATSFKRFTYDELKKATNNFSQEIGRGGSSIVYKGVVLDNRVAAIKRFKEENFRGEAEFLAEISIIERLNHINLIETWGYCVKRKQRILVSEYLDNGSLADKLSSNALDWEKIYNIAVGTAKGLAYLHEECLEWVLHCDVKPHNILLDSNYEPKVADFGLSKLLQRDVTGNSRFSRIRGTRGYMAPEWISNQSITSKVDVYSYGIVVLEMISGRNPATNVYDDTDGSCRPEQKMLVKWIRDKMQAANGTGKDFAIRDIVDSRMNGVYDMPRMEALVQVALQCVEDQESARPTMSQVVDMLVGNTQIVHNKGLMQINEELVEE
ncbi:putative receptor protein kinase ZmPK1 [Apium graveolens]|uniref:putative receptor protein kinase ZmPK1 n=1 Tax=Apium graveolens TaxID=4045 RepID=UPI003D78B323